MFAAKFSFILILLFFYSSPLWASPQRVVTLAPSLGELAADVLGEHLERIVGVSEYSDEPPALKSVSSIGPYNHFNLEKVVSLKPDLVLATTDGNSKDQVEHLRELGITVVVVSGDHISDIEASVATVAHALGEEARGEKIVHQFHQGLENLRARAKGRKRKRVLLELEDSPLIVVGGRTFIDDGLTLVGAENIYHDSLIRYPHPSLEDVVKKTLKPLSSWEQGKTPLHLKKRKFIGRSFHPFKP